jgi:hypothetical protein
MATALSLVRDSVFGPDATQAMGAAFEMGIGSRRRARSRSAVRADALPVTTYKANVGQTRHHLCYHFATQLGGTP